MDEGERILTLHPSGKTGVRIPVDKYDMMKSAIIDSLEEYGELTFNMLMQEVDIRLHDRFHGSIGWYFTTVKLDMEAREIIERIGNGSPQRIRIRSNAK